MYATDGMILRIMDGPPQPADWPIGLKAGTHMALLGFEVYLVYSLGLWDCQRLSWIEKRIRRLLATRPSSSTATSRMSAALSLGGAAAPTIPLSSWPTSRIGVHQLLWNPHPSIGFLIGHVPTISNGKRSCSWNRRTLRTRRRAKLRTSLPQGLFRLNGSRASRSFHGRRRSTSIDEVE